MEKLEALPYSLKTMFIVEVQKSHTGLANLSGAGNNERSNKTALSELWNNMILYGYLQSLMHIILVQEKPLKKLDLFWRA